MIQVVTRALDILEFVARKGGETVSLSEIAEGVGLNQTTCANIIKTLVAKNYLDHPGRKTGYKLGAGAYHLTGNMAYSQNLILAAKEPMEKLTAQLNETCLLGILRNNKRFLAHVVQSDQDLQVRTRSESDIYPTASGRILMAFLSDKEQENLIQAVGLPQPTAWPDIHSKEDLLAALRDIRQKELAFTLSTKHIVGLAVPIRKSKQVIASLSIFLPESRYNTANQAHIIQSLRTTAQQINERLQLEG
jgi:DNA-binding IclR family transcriptional regulator